MTAQDLKNSVLQRAMQGKLVEQRAEEGTAIELIELGTKHPWKELQRQNLEL